MSIFRTKTPFSASFFPRWSRMHVTATLLSLTLTSQLTAAPLASMLGQNKWLDSAIAAEQHSENETPPATDKKALGPVINFNNVSIVEFLRFVSRLTGKNFIFDPQELQFPVTIISESPASLEDVMAALLQNLRIHDFELLEQGSSFLIHRNKTIKSPTELYREGLEITQEPQLATQVFLVKYADITRAGSIVKTMTSPDAIVEVIEETRRVVVTDIVTNIKKIADLIASFDSPNSGIEIGQYVLQNATPAAIIAITEQIMEPIVGNQPFSMVPHDASNSIYVVSTPFFVEKALSVIQSIDVNENVSRVFSFDTLRFNAEEAQQRATTAKEQQAVKDLHSGFNEEEINQLSDDEVRRILMEKGYRPDQILKMTEDEIKKALREALGPEGQKIRTEMRRKKLFESNLPIGQVESTKFLIHKLQYRKSTDIAKALKSIASSLRSHLNPTESGSPQSELVITLNTISSIEENNSLVFSGTTATLTKVKDLISQLDIPVRQVFIECLVLDTTIQNSLQFGVEWEGKLQRHNNATQFGLLNPQSPIPSTMNAVTQTSPNPMNPIPITQGFSAGTIGRKIKFHNTGFVAFAALINALRSDNETNIIMNPKITTEHNVPAEIFVGAQIPVKGQTITNTNSDFVTTNFETVNTGITLKVTPLISSHQTVTLIIEQTISSASQQQVNAQALPNAPPATINETKTTTRVHLPSGYFLVMSGMIQDQRTVTKVQIPCLGAIPFIGNAFAQSGNQNDNRNLMLFIRPHIIDTDLDIEEITRKQQNIWDDKAKPIRKSRTPFDDMQDILNL